MTINRGTYEGIKEKTIPTIKIDVRISDEADEQKAIAFTYRTQAINQIALENGKTEQLSKALEKASRILTEAVREALNG